MKMEMALRSGQATAHSLVVKGGWRSCWRRRRSSSRNTTCTKELLFYGNEECKQEFSRFSAIVEGKEREDNDDQQKCHQPTTITDKVAMDEGLITLNWRLHSHDDDHVTQCRSPWLYDQEEDDDNNTVVMNRNSAPLPVLCVCLSVSRFYLWLYLRKRSFSFTKNKDPTG